MVVVPPITGAPVGMFLTKDPDTGEVVAPDSSPTVEVWALNGQGAALSGFEVSSVAVGHYYVYLDDPSDIDQPFAGTFFCWKVTVTINGESRTRIGGLFRVGAPHLRGVVTSSISNTATTFSVQFFDDAANEVEPAGVSALSGALIVTTDRGNEAVRRIASYDNILTELTLAEPLAGVPAAGTTFIVVTQ